MSVIKLILFGFRYYQPSKRLTQRRKGFPLEIVAYAHKAGRRLSIAELLRLDINPYFCYLLQALFMAPYPSGKGEVCKTFMHRFEPGRRLYVQKKPLKRVVFLFTSVSSRSCGADRLFHHIFPLPAPVVGHCDHGTSI